nr:retrotransposon protein, putative, Ty1-copia subclass [Tanacetum cinerariifolium]
MWSRHPSNYRMLRIFDCVAYPHNKQGKIKPRAVKCVLLGYLEGVKGYRLYKLDDELPKIVTSRNVVFNESVMYKDTLKDTGACNDKSVEELQVEVELQREPRTRTKPLMFQDKSNTAAYTFVAAEEEDTHEPLTYQEAIIQLGKKLVSCKWLFKIKEWIKGVQKPRYKARLLACGFTQRADYELEQLDVKMTFLHGNLKEVIYMRHPPGYEQSNKVCLLKKSLYGLKQSHRQWYKRFDEYMLSNGFKRSNYDSCEFDINELEEAKKILGMELVRDRSRKILRVLQSGYVSKILNNFRIDNGKSVKMSLGGHFKLSLNDCPVRDSDVERMSKVSYANVVGSLTYLMVCTRPDITYAGTANVGLVYDTDRGNHLDVTGFGYSDYAKDPDKEAEYMALTEAVKEAIWLKGLLEELGVELNTVAVNYDNQGAIHLSWNHVFHERTKNINVRYHFIIKVLEAKAVNVLKVGTEDNAAKALTNVVPGLKLQHFLKLLNYGVMLKSGFLDLGGGGGRKKQGNVIVLFGSCYDSAFPSLSNDAGTICSQDVGLKEGNTVNIGSTGQVAGGTPSGNPASYANKLSPASLAKANVRKLDSSVPNDAGYDIWLPLDLVHEVNVRMKNTLYGYFIGKRLAFPVVEWFVRNNWKKYGLEKVTLVKCFFFFEFSSTKGVDSVLRNGPWMISEVPIFLNKWSPSANVEVELGNKDSTSSVQEKEQCATSLVEKINIEDEVEPVDNEMTNSLASKQSGVGYGTKSLLEQYREIYRNAKYDYDPYDDDLYEVPTPMVEQAKLKLDLVGKPVDHTYYRSMIRSLMYVTSSRPDIMFATYADHAGCHLDRKSTSGSVQFLGDKLVCWSSKKQNCVSISTAESEYVAVSSCCA